jgi:DNA segregation ATPase FtsK/SpoIIIE, S-DNA-T family
MILGTGTHQAGIKATMFTLHDKGISWAVGIAEDPIIVCSAYLDRPTSNRIADRATNSAFMRAGSPVRPPAKPRPRSHVRPAHRHQPHGGEAAEQRGREPAGRAAPRRLRPMGGLEDEAKTATLTARLKEYGVKTEDTGGRTPSGMGANRRASPASTWPMPGQRGGRRSARTRPTPPPINRRRTRRINREQGTMKIATAPDATQRATGSTRPT